MKRLAVFILAIVTLVLPARQAAAQGFQLPNMKVTSSAFADGATIPLKFTSHGQNVQPDFQITGAPDTTKSYVIIMHDILGAVPYYQYVAWLASQKYNQKKNIGLVVGATAPKQLAEVRKIIGDEMFVLIPGAGAQGGSVNDSVKAGRNSIGQGFVLNSSRQLIAGYEPATFNREVFTHFVANNATRTHNEIGIASAL